MAHIVTGLESVSDPYTKRILTYLSGRDALKVYSQTPFRLRRLLKGLSEAKMQLTTPERKWSIAQILHHLCDAELVMAYRYRMALAQSGNALQAYDEQKWASASKYGSARAKRKLELFLTLRDDNIRLLSALGSEEWERFGVHEERGKETVERMMQMTAGHDVNHLRQIAALRVAARSARKR
jgi:hypothetical protein